ncbi:S8 family peptidase [Bacillus cereus]|uniref:S8 family peptidase n=1 Tax=Bacillus cereus TaxID=1396 RepID=UPI003D64EB95
MKKLSFIFLSFLAILICNTNEILAEEDQNKYFVTFKSEVNENYIKSNGAEIVKCFTTSPTVLIKASEKAVANIQSNENIVSAIEPDEEVVASDVDFDISEIDLDPQEQLIPWNVNYIKAPTLHKLGLSGKKIKIGIIDSGIADHKDLNVVDGINILDHNSNFRDDFGHGTKVAGVIGALNNSYGLVGVAPDSNLYAIKVLNSKGKGSISNVVSGIEYAIEKNLDIVNLSLQTTTNNSVLKKTIEKAYENNIVIVAAAGNKGGDKGSNTVTYPALYDEVISVGAINHNGKRYALSSIGQIDLVAPGEYVYTTVLDDMYFLYHGTSMATPHVVGVAALLLEHNSSLKNRDIKNILMNSATDIGDFEIYGKGVLNAEKAFDLTKKY